MNVHLDHSHDAQESQSIASSPTMEPRPFYWSIRREMWENRSIYIAPLIITALVLFASLITVLTLPMRTHTLAAQDPARVQGMLLKPFNAAPAPIMLTALIVGFFYCLDALYGERRDRSILFWKSLPVSDVTTVLSKAAVPLLVLPLIAYALSVATLVVMLTLSLPVLASSSVSVLKLWSDLHFFQLLIVMFYGLAVLALWFAPIYGVLLLISAWAKRAPLLWAVLPVVAVGAVERLIFNSSLFITMVGYRVTGAMGLAFAKGTKQSGDYQRLAHLTPLKFLSSPGLWIGLIVAAACLAAAVRMRRNREPI